MSDNLLYTYVTGFDRSVRETVEVKGGKLRPFVQLATGDLYRSDGVYQRTTGGGLPQKITNRFGDSPVSEIDYSRRRVARTAYDDGQFMDWVDVVRMGTDVRNPKLNAMKAKFQRQEDIILQQALLGSANGGDNGQTTTAFTAGNIVGVTLGAAAGVTNAGFNYDKFTKALQLLGTNNVDIEMYSPVFVLSYQQWHDMMQDDKFINFDYTGARAVDGGTPGAVRDYMGCKFVFTNVLPYMDTAGTSFQIADADIDTTNGDWNDDDGTDIRAGLCFVQDAALLEINPDITTDISKRNDKKGNWYAYMKMDLGAVRMEEEKVIAIPCDQSPA